MLRCHLAQPFRTTGSRPQARLLASLAMSRTTQFRIASDGDQETPVLSEWAFPADERETPCMAPVAPALPLPASGSGPAQLDQQTLLFHQFLQFQRAHEQGLGAMSLDSEPGRRGSPLNPSGEQAGPAPKKHPIKASPEEATGMTSAEGRRAAARPAATRREQEKKLTGTAADFATLSANRSSDVVENTKLTIMAHLTTFQWKKFVWMLKARQAMQQEGRRWTRNPRWLASLFGREMGWLWGHLGAARQALATPRGARLFAVGSSAGATSSA